MDFEISEENRMVRESIREFAERKIAPLVEEAEATSEIQHWVMANGLGL